MAFSAAESIAEAFLNESGEKEHTDLFVIFTAGKLSHGAFQDQVVEVAHYFSFFESVEDNGKFITAISESGHVLRKLLFEEGTERNDKSVSEFVSVFLVHSLELVNINECKRGKFFFMEEPFGAFVKVSAIE